MSSSVKCYRLENKVAIITAATKGIGLAIAERLGLEGCSIVISSRNEKNVQDSVKYLRGKGIKNVEGITCHVAKDEDRKRLVNFTLEKFKKINILINNHGINPVFGDMLSVSEEVWDKLFETNVKAGFLLTKLVVPHILESGGGSIIFNASYGAYRQGKGIAAYTVTKTTLLGLTKALSDELSPQGIRVNAIAPGVIKTKMSKAMWDGKDGEENLVNALETPMGRLGTPEECSGAVAYLVSDDASYVTGETIVIAGGIHARL
uniref:Dehydrogenase/reductase SDR family member 4 (projected from Caenorhabditis elegans ortholog dhrs-4) n=1 Tax=Strongyloides venezuelensis TaxID=75913 RepID=A0A0K0FE92_STRVS